MNRDILEVSGSSAGTVLNETPIAATDVGRFNSVQVQLIGTWTGTIIFEASNDGTTWYTNPMMGQTSMGYYGTITSNSLSYGLLTGRYFRARVSVGGTGTVQAKALFSTRPVVQQHGVVVHSSAGSVASVVPAQESLSSANGLMVCSQNLDFNNSQFDRHRSNFEATVLASAARTTSTNSSDQTNYNGAGATLTIDVTSVTDTPSITVAIKYKDTLSGKYVALLTSAAITAVGTYTLRVYPGCVAVANEVANAPLPRVWRAEVTHADTDSITYSISANYNN
jgi:hypothetical protein